MDVKLLSGALGAEISGISLNNINKEIFSTVNELLLEHKVIFFRDQNITPEEQIKFAKFFGPIEEHAYVKAVSYTHLTLPTKRIV